MPELPEVETLARALRRVADGATMETATFFREDLRTPIPVSDFRKLLCRRPITGVERRSKYILLRTDKGVGILHLGMTGNILVRSQAKPDVKHTHAVFRLRHGDELSYLHFVDPRRFGVIDCCATEALASHPMLANLGPEPLTPDFDLGAHLFQRSRGRRVPIKTFIMDAQILVGVGNIYASESLFRTGIAPNRAASDVSAASYQALAAAIRETLLNSIEAGGTTFRDYKSLQGQPGYYAVALAVYGREGEPCQKCRTPIATMRLGGRSTFFCPVCQKT